MMHISINICKLLALHSYHQMDADLHISFMFTSFRSCFIIIHKGRFHCSCKFFVGSSPSIHFNFYYLQFNSILQLTTAIVNFWIMEQETFTVHQWFLILYVSNPKSCPECSLTWNVLKSLFIKNIFLIIFVDIIWLKFGFRVMPNTIIIILWRLNIWNA